MEVPTLSAKQIRASLSKKSPLPVKSVRKAMQSPYQTFWPVPKDVTEIREIIHNLLVPVQRRSAWISWLKYKDMTAEELSQVKKDFKLKNKKKHLRTHVHFGMNELMHGLENHSVCSAVVCEDIQPTFLMNMMLDLMNIHHIPVIILPKLKELTKETMGFSCSCIGLKCAVSENKNSHFNPLHEKIVELASEHQLPENKVIIQCPKDVCVEPGELWTPSEDQEFEKLQCNRGSDDFQYTLQTDSQSLSSCKGDWKAKKGQLRNRKSILHGKRKRNGCKDEIGTPDETCAQKSTELLHERKRTTKRSIKGIEKAVAMGADGKSMMDTGNGFREVPLRTESPDFVDNETVSLSVREHTSNSLHGIRSPAKGSKLYARCMREAHPYLRTFENRHLRYLKLCKQRYVSNQRTSLSKNTSGNYAKTGKHKFCSGNEQKLEYGDNAHPENEAMSEVCAEDVRLFHHHQKKENISAHPYMPFRLKETTAKVKPPKKVKTKE